MQRRFFTLDVFTARPFAGNPLAVVLDADGLDQFAMQQIAREFNLSETVFVLPPAKHGTGRVYASSRPRANCPLPAIPRWGRRCCSAAAKAARKRAAWCWRRRSARSPAT
jgi:trans-2,3-dihydro-3-hydroxyanthranilate isomerase